MDKRTPFSIVLYPFTPGSPYAPGASRVVVATSSEKSDMSEFARFMVSRELINTSLTKFDDRAESYRAWKATFKAAIANLNFTAEQELDLLIKWLGPGSTNRIKSLRTVYVGQAEAGLAAAWQRLERTFGSAEAIEKALFKRLQDIPKINLKEVHKLQDLSDLLMELELAKRDPRLSGLCYLDTAHGVNPIVVKLPYSLQEKWATSVSRYKRMHDVTFPPFIQFCKFIDEQIELLFQTDRFPLKSITKYILTYQTNKLFQNARMCPHRHHHPKLSAHSDNPKPLVSDNLVYASTVHQLHGLDIKEVIPATSQKLFCRTEQRPLHNEWSCADASTELWMHSVALVSSTVSLLLLRQ
ncbi:uncharacterized protein ACNLHF_007053 [Anomaloglossus baeobatrachus]